MTGARVGRLPEAIERDGCATLREIVAPDLARPIATRMREIENETFPDRLRRGPALPR